MKTTNEITPNDVKRLLQTLEMFLKIDIELKEEASLKNDYYGKAYYAGSEQAYHRAMQSIRIYLGASEETENITPKNNDNETKID